MAAASEDAPSVGARSAPPPAAHASDCGICLQALSAIPPDEEGHASLDGCSHLFCFACIARWARIRASCPLCRSDFSCVTSSKPGPNGEVRSLHFETVQSSEDDEESFEGSEEDEEDEVDEEEEEGDRRRARRLSMGGVFSQSESDGAEIEEEDSEDDGFVVPDSIVEYEEGAGGHCTGEMEDEVLALGSGSLFEPPQAGRRAAGRSGARAREEERRRAALAMLESRIARASTRPSFHRPSQAQTDEIITSGWFSHPAPDASPAPRPRRAARSQRGGGDGIRAASQQKDRRGGGGRSRGTPSKRRSWGRRRGGEEEEESPELRVRRRAVDPTGAFASSLSVFAYRSVACPFADPSVDSSIHTHIFIHLSIDPFIHVQLPFPSISLSTLRPHLPPLPIQAEAPQASYSPGHGSVCEPRCGRMRRQSRCSIQQQRSVWLGRKSLAACRGEYGSSEGRREGRVGGGLQDGRGLASTRGG